MPGAQGAPGTTTHYRHMVRHLLPGLILPGLIYLIASRFLPTIEALAVASAVPLIDVIVRVAQGKKPTLIGLGFLIMTGVSVGLALGFRSPLFILVKGAVVSAVIGLAFGFSALIHRPLTRSLAISLSTEPGEARDALTERWHHPKALDVFRTLSIGWGVLLMVSAAQQATLALTIRPGLVMALEPPIQAAATLTGVALSVVFVRRRQRAHPELAILPRRQRAASTA